MTNKEGIILSVRLGDTEKLGINQDEIRGMFKDMGKGLDIDYRVEVVFPH